MNTSREPSAAAITIGAEALVVLAILAAIAFDVNGIAQIISGLFPGF